MNNCPYCTTVVEEEFNFCPSCERQVRCVHCKGLLVVNKSKCLVCGTPLVSFPIPPLSYNEYSFEEERTDGNYKRQVRLKFTDTAIDKVGQYLPNSLFTDPPLAFPGQNAPPLVKTPSIPINSSDNENERLVSSIVHQEDNRIEDNRINDTQTDWIEQYVFKNGERLEIKLTDFKGKTRKEQMRRFVLLFVWGYNKYFSQPVPNREPITRSAKELNVWDTTFSHLITQLEKKVLVKSDDGIRLAPGANSEITTLLQDLQDSSIRGISLRSTKTTRKSATLQSKTDTNALVTEWLQKPSNLDNYDVRELGNIQARQKVQFGLWVLKKKYGVDHAPLDAVVDFTLKAFPQIGGNARSMKNAVANKKYVGRTSQQECYLTAEGEKDIQSLLPESLKSL